MNIFTSRGKMQVPNIKTCVCGKTFVETQGYNGYCSTKCQRDALAVIDYNLDLFDKHESIADINMNAIKINSRPCC